MALGSTQPQPAWYAGQEDRHTKQSHRLIIPDDVLIQFDLLMMSTVMLETCIGVINKDIKKCVKLVISKEL